MFPLPQRLRRISFFLLFGTAPVKENAIKTVKPPTRPLELGHARLPAPPARPLARSSAAGSSREWRRHTMRSGSRRPCELDKSRLHLDCTGRISHDDESRPKSGRSFPRKIRRKKSRLDLSFSLFFPSPHALLCRSAAPLRRYFCRILVNIV